MKTMKRWVQFCVAAAFVMLTYPITALAADPFGQLSSGSSSLPSFITNPLDDIRAIIGLILLIIGAWKMMTNYHKGNHKIVYASIFVLILIEWVIWSPETLFTVASNVFGWISTHWFGGGN